MKTALGTALYIVLANFPHSPSKVVNAHVHMYTGGQHK